MLYCPVLRLKRGEINAISQLDDSVKSLIFPIFFIGSGDDISFEANKRFLNDRWGIYPAYYERESYENVDQNEYIAFINDATFNLIPVYSDYNVSDVSIIKNVAHIKNECCIRLSCSDIDVSSFLNQIQKMERDIGLSKEYLHLILDFETLDSDRNNQNYIYISTLINAIPELERWKRIVTLASSLPNTVTGLPIFTVIEASHEEWLQWKRLHQEYRNIFYGDYASVVAGIDYDTNMRNLRPATKIKYLCEDKWLIVRGEQTKKGFDQFRRLSNILANDERFMGKEHCYAEQFIEECANGGKTGNLTTWVTVSVCHHIKLMTEQLANFDEI